MKAFVKAHPQADNPRPSIIITFEFSDGLEDVENLVVASSAQHNVSIIKFVKLGEEKTHYAEDQRVKRFKLWVVLGEREAEGFKFSLAPMFPKPIRYPLRVDAP